MKKLLFVVLCLPLFAMADEGFENSEVLSEGVGITQPAAEEQALIARGARCGRHSDVKCYGRRVYDDCERDSSHGIYGRCYNYGQRSPHVVCGCR